MFFEESSLKDDLSIFNYNGGNNNLTAPLGSSEIIKCNQITIKPNIVYGENYLIKNEVENNLTNQ